jgi:hypothetical protein
VQDVLRCRNVVGLQDVLKVVEEEFDAIFEMELSASLIASLDAFVSPKKLYFKGELSFR